MSIDRRTKVLIVDDSRTICRLLVSVFSQDPDFEVVGFAMSSIEARTMIKQLTPDVITLDVEMPGMDGLTFLKNLMRLRPMPVVMLSSLTEAGANETLDALQIGAVDFMPKRSSADGVDMDEYFRELRQRVKAAAGVCFQTRQKPKDKIPLPELSQCIEKLATHKSEAMNGIKRLVAIGASTGGPEALRVVLQTLEVNNCALVISQHMQPRYVASFAERLSKSSAFDIRVAVDGEKISKGRGYMAPGDHHLELARQPDGFYWKVLSTPKVSGHRPSVNVLFESIARHAASQCVASLLTGMGDDGATGLLSLRQAGAVTFAQDKDSSVIWGMPGRAVELNAADCVLDLSQLAPAVNTLLH